MRWVRERDEAETRGVGEAAGARSPLVGAQTRDVGKPHVVAEILSDGTVQVLDRAAVDTPLTPWGSGVIGGPGWTLWWERRRWA